MNKTFAVLIFIGLTTPSCRGVEKKEDKSLELSSVKGNHELPATQATEHEKKNESVLIVEPVSIKNKFQKNLQELDLEQENLYLIGSENFEGLDLLSIKIKAKDESDIPLIESIDYSEFFLCRQNQTVSHCEKEKSLETFSSAQHLYFLPIEQSEVLFIRACLRPSPTQTGSCSKWLKKPIPDYLKSQNISKEKIDILKKIYRIEHALLSSCTQYKNISETYLKTPAARNENYEVIAQNILLLGEDHCRGLYESGTIRDVTGLFHFLATTTKTESEAKESEEHPSSNIFHSFPPYLVPIALISFGSISILKTIYVACEHCQLKNHLSTPYGTGRMALRGSLMLFLLTEMTVGIFHLVDTLSEEGHNEPFPIITTLVLSYIALEMGLKIKSWHSEDKQKEIETKVKKLQTEIEPSVEITRSVNSEKIIKENPSALHIKTAPHGTGLKQLEHGFHKYGKIIGGIFGVLEITNLLTDNAVDRAFSLNDAHASDLIFKNEIEKIYEANQKSWMEYDETVASLSSVK
ncbi:MAG: hypothetical protein KA436_04690 [Oligoflexales bacterium]|nr:hypothetical protein [Oligoflexales bacterium]